MPSHIRKVLKMQVGEYVDGAGKTHPEMREIGVEIEHEKDGQTWSSYRLHADILSPVLYQMTKPFMPRGASGVTVRAYDLARKKPAPTDPTEPDDVDRPF